MNFGYISVPLGLILLLGAVSALRSGYGEPGNTTAVYQAVIGFAGGGLLSLLGLAELVA